MRFYLQNRSVVIFQIRLLKINPFLYNLLLERNKIKFVFQMMMVMIQFLAFGLPYAPYYFNMTGTYRVKMPQIADSQMIAVEFKISEWGDNIYLGISNYDGYGASISIPATQPYTSLICGRMNYRLIELTKATSYNYFAGTLQRKLNSNNYEFYISCGAQSESDPNFIKRQFLVEKLIRNKKHQNYDLFLLFLFSPLLNVSFAQYNCDYKQTLELAPKMHRYLFVL